MGTNNSWNNRTAAPLTVAQGDILYGSAINVISSLTKDANATRYLSNTGTSNNPAWAQINLTNGVTGALPILNGGTGQTAKTQAFDALSPTTTKGDLIVSNGTNNVRVGIGTNNQALIVDSAQANGLKWANVTATTVDHRVQYSYTGGF